jgi:hypothetical protein
MRFRLVVLLATFTAVIAGVGAGLTLAAAPPTIPPVPTVPGAPPGAGYNFDAQFTLEYEVKWSKLSGDPTQDCSGWSLSQGTNEVYAQSVGRIQGHIQINTGTASPGRVTLVAVGKAKGFVLRRLTDKGGFKEPSGGCGYDAPKYVAPTNDCGRRHFTTRNATLLATQRTFDGTLDASRPSVNIQGAYQRDYIDFAVVPDSSARLYRSCESTGRRAPEFPVKNVGIIVSVPAKTALSKLKPGNSYLLKAAKFDGLGIDCTDELPKGETCTYNRELYLRIHRAR